MAANNKVALIVGGGKEDSLGYGIARAFAEAGYSLALAGRGKGKLVAAGELEACGVRVLPLPCKMGDDGDVAAVVERAVSELGRLDVLVNASCVAKASVLADASCADLRRALDEGLVGSYAFMRACYPHLAAAGGTVINFASGSAAVGTPGQGLLAAAKEGLRGVSRVAASEWAPDDVTVNVVCALTENSRVREWAAQDGQTYDDLVASIPAGRLGDAHDDAGALCVFLAGEGGRYITGQTLYLQGGLGLRP